ncbi:hypothetical protein HPB49_024110 [Dermacentor silvarum]|uniref:Uncharacterized protein n=1 Tax=Dermacentor silvarum TaxID=543639 RepID=A0ACB8CC51_DERSI|nr:hypothetical protein HPB49_024110 [Dermacentor silvarum]
MKDKAHYKEQAQSTASPSYSHSSDHGPAPSADWPDPGPDGSSDFYEDQFRLRDAGSLRPAAPYEADRQRALIEGLFHRAPVQQLSLTSPTNDPAPCSILESCSAFRTTLQPAKVLITRPAPQPRVMHRCAAHDARIPAHRTVKNDGPVKVSKIAINQLERLPSDNGKLVFQCTAISMRKRDAQREPRGASCSEGRYLYKLSEPPCDYSEQCVFAQLNGVCTDHLIGDCALEFVRLLDGKTCDKLHTTAGNVLDSPTRPTANATLPEPLASRTSKFAKRNSPRSCSDLQKHKRAAHYSDTSTIPTSSTEAARHKPIPDHLRTTY